MKKTVVSVNTEILLLGEIASIMNKKDPIAEIHKLLMESVVDFDKLPADLKSSTFEYIEFRRELTKESDRGCALLAAAHLDSMLEKLLRKVLLGNKKHFELLFGFTGPVGTFSSRILLSYSLGLISAEALHDIQIIRKIRNDFGHKPSIIGFEDQSLKDQCNNLRFTVHDKNATARHKFLNVVSAISGQLDAKIIQSTKFKEEKDLDLVKRKKNFEKMMSIVRQKMESK